MSSGAWWFTGALVGFALAVAASFIAAELSWRRHGPPPDGYTRRMGTQQQNQPAQPNQQPGQPNQPGQQPTQPQPDPRKDDTRDDDNPNG